MKKSLLLSALMAATCAMTQAQSLNVLPTSADPYLFGITMSANGKYVGGTDVMGLMFVSDWADGKVTLTENADEDLGSQVRCVSNSGVGYGFNGDYCVSFSIDGTEKTYNDGTEGMISGCTPDGKTLVGYLKEDIEVNGKEITLPRPYIWKDGATEGTMLPFQMPDELGIKGNGTLATYISEDASVICGYYIYRYPTRPIVMWHRQADGTYKYDPVFKRHIPINGTDIDGIMSPTGMSANGKWVALTVSDGNIVKLGRYDVENDKVEIIDYEDLGDGDIMEGAGIANDGAMVGYGTTELENRYGLYCPAGSTKAQLLSVAFPGVTELADFDNDGMHVPGAITPDGRYICGYAEREKGGNAIYNTYVLDTKGEAGVGSITVSETNGVQSAYSLDGHRVNLDSHRGLTIIKGADGKVSKVLKR